jgi:dTDP-4-dehydrorhamnose reductase
MPKILVTGAGGFLGSYLCKFSGDVEISSLQRAVRETNAFLLICKGKRSILDNSDFRKIIEKAFEESNCDVVINCIANTSAERCELEPEDAFYVNAMIPLLISESAEKFNIKVVHISTDAVFGQNGSHFSPDTIPKPKSIYGKSKLFGERNVSSINPNNLIIRTNFFGNYKHKTTLFNYFYNNLIENNPVIGFTNQIFTPMYIEDLVVNIYNLTTTKESGIFHMGGDFTISKYDLAIEIAELMGIPKSLVIAREYSNDPKGPTRNLDISLDSTKSSRFIIKNSTLSEGVQKAISLS